MQIAQEIHAKDMLVKAIQDTNAEPTTAAVATENGFLLPLGSLLSVQLKYSKNTHAPQFDVQELIQNLVIAD